MYTDGADIFILLKDGKSAISYRLHDPKDEPRPDKFLSVDTFFCKDRADLPPSLQSTDEGKLFDFTTTVSTNLNILWMGDSLGHQFSQGIACPMQEFACSRQGGFACSTQGFACFKQ